MSVDLRIVDDPVAHIHADRLVEAGIAALETRTTFREDAAIELVEAVHEHLRDGSDVVEMRVGGLTRAEWDGKDGLHVNGWSKRQEFRAHGGGLVAALIWDTDEGWDGR